MQSSYHNNYFANSQDEVTYQEDILKHCILKKVRAKYRQTDVFTCFQRVAKVVNKISLTA